MPVVVNPVDTITLTVGGESIECQITSHTISDADPSSGDTLRTGCGDVVNIPADAAEVGTLDLTLLPERGVSGFVAWTWAHATETAAFTLTENPGTPEVLVWAGDVTVAAIQAKQDEYTKIETVDWTVSITAWTKRALAA